MLNRVGKKSEFVDGLRVTDAETGDQYASIITYDGTDPQLVIPETLQDVPVTEIGYRAFLENAVITGVTLPSTLKKIGDRAFMFTNVGDIDLPAGLERRRVGLQEYFISLMEEEDQR